MNVPRTRVLLLLLCSGVLGRAQPTVYNTTSTRDPAKLNIHLVPHTHDDSGWLKTFEQYYWGSRQDIQMAAVQYVLSTVVQALKQNPDRRFSYAEMSFFTRWWDLQPPSVQADVKELVASGQLDFINGGFVQHDEATAHYAAMIDQTTRGHRFLNQTFGMAPKVAWQIDPFGHSATQAALMSAAAGFEALFFGRADYQDMHQRSLNRQLELLWRPSASWGASGQIFTHNYPSGNYGPPGGFNFDWGLLDPPIVDDPTSPECNVKARVELFVSEAQTWANLLRGNDILFMMGSDFQYANAYAIFQNLDKLIHHVNADGRVHVLYSTPAAYVAAKAAYKDAAWPVKTDDFFPYADCAHCYWTGYFTSRPTSKGYIRQATAYLAAARQLQALVTPDIKLQQQQQQQQQVDAAATAAATEPGSISSSKVNNRRAGLGALVTGSSSGSGSGSSSSSSGDKLRFSLDALELAVSMSQHHDAVTGTEKQHVANDYARYLDLGMEQAEKLVNAALEQLLTASSSSSSGSGNSTQQSSSSSSSSKWMFNFATSIWKRINSPAATLADVSRVLLEGWGFGVHAIRSNQLTAAAAATGGTTTPTAAAAAGGGGIKLSQCPLLNISICAASVAATSTSPTAQQSSNVTAGEAHSSSGSSSSSGGSSSSLLVVVYNSLAWPREEYVRVPVGDQQHLKVTDADGLAVHSQVLPVSAVTLQLQQQYAAAGLAGNTAAAATHELVFRADVPPVGYSTYAVQAVQQQQASADDSSSKGSTAGAAQEGVQGAVQQQYSRGLGSNQHRQLSTGHINITLDAATGRFVTAAAADGSWTLGFRQDIMWYKSSTGSEENSAAAAAASFLHKAGDNAADASGSSSSSSAGSCSSSSSNSSPHNMKFRCGSKDGRVNGGQSSGAYIFRPAGDAPVAAPLLPDSQPVQVDVIEGPVVTEVRQAWAPWASLTTRLWQGADWIEQEWSVGPIPAADGVGKEVVVRTTTDLASGGYLFTDSNGRELQTRRRNMRPTWKLNVTEPVAGNYFPITAAAAITDGCLGFGVATDRAQGAASLQDGQLEIMLHRITAVDDARGVGEPLNETICGLQPCLAGGLPARGRHFLILGPMNTPDAAAASGTVPRWLRQAQQQLNDPLLLAFAQLPHESSGAQSPAAGSNSAAAAAAAAAAATGGSSGGVAGSVPVSSSSSSSTAADLAASYSNNNAIAALHLQGRWSGLAATAAGAAAGGDKEVAPTVTSPPTAAAAAAVTTTTAEHVSGLPSNVHLLTLMRADEVDASKLIIRLAHSFQVGEDVQYSRPVRVNLSKLLGRHWHITAIQEVSLTANQFRKDMPKPRAWPAETKPMSNGMSKSKVESEAADADNSALYPLWGNWHEISQAVQDRITNHTGGSTCFSKQQQQPEQQQQQRRLQESDVGKAHAYDIWDHAGDQLPVVELYPMEIRTWLVELETT